MKHTRVLMSLLSMTMLVFGLGSRETAAASAIDTVSMVPSTETIATSAPLDKEGDISNEDQPYAPLDRPGPRLSVHPTKLRAALDCTPDLRQATRPAVILIPGTRLDPETNFSWNYIPAFRRAERPYCTLALPDDGRDDIQVAGEYVVYALREVARVSGMKVDVVGYSQGGMVPRWALRFWPDTRELVGDLVALAPPNHGSYFWNIACQQPCPPSGWQQRSDAKFIDALNSLSETFAGIGYTVVYTHADQFSTPNVDGSASSLQTGPGQVVNVAIQDVCPNDVSEHLAIGTYDPVAYALAIDALDNHGPADPGRIPVTVCTDPFMPGVDQTTFAEDYMRFLRVLWERGDYPGVAAEPPLKPYVFAQSRPVPSGQSPQSQINRMSGREEYEAVPSRLVHALSSRFIVRELMCPGVRSLCL